MEDGGKPADSAGNLISRISSLGSLPILVTDLAPPRKLVEDWEQLESRGVIDNMRL